MFPSVRSTYLYYVSTAHAPSRRVCGFIYTLISIDRGIRARLNYQTNSPMHVHRDAVRSRPFADQSGSPICVTCDLVACSRALVRNGIADHQVKRAFFKGAEAQRYPFFPPLVAPIIAFPFDINYNCTRLFRAASSPRRIERIANRSNRMKGKPSYRFASCAISSIRRDTINYLARERNVKSGKLTLYRVNIGFARGEHMSAV